jgi:beta-aspartyl-dipeptidase (metallo-type)
LDAYTMSNPTPTLIKNAELFSPEPLGVRDVLCAGGKIIAVDNDLQVPTALGAQEIDAAGHRLIPGLIDGHVHIAGAGGEGGPATRTPEMPLSWMIEAGVTTVIGLLGADGTARHVDAVLMKAKGLRAEGVSCWIYTGAYQLPVPTITGDVARDIAMIEEVIGVGEVAIADHRSSSPTVLDLTRLAKQARLGGMLGGKCGIVHVHLGDAERPFDLIRQAVEQSELTFGQFHPTHVNRNEHAFEEAKSYGKEGSVDITTSAYPYFPEEEVKPSRAIRELLEAGVPLDHITMSSDACGSLPEFNDKGELVRILSARLVATWRETSEAVRDEGLDLEHALATVTLNPARILRLAGKGSIALGKDADLVLIDENLEIRTVMANGTVLMEDGEIIKKGTFES